MRMMTRMGQTVLDELGTDGEFVKAVHTVGAPLDAGPGRRAVAVQRDEVHHPLPGDPRDLVLRLGLRRQRPARQEVLRAAHRLGDGPRRGLAGRAHADPQAHAARAARPSTSPRRSRAPAARPTWRCSPRPSRAGRSRPSATTSPGCASAQDGRLYAINPEAGFFGVAPGTGRETNANAIETLYANSVFTNVALTDDGDVWWEGLTEEKPAHLTDWKGRDWTPDSAEPAAHPNARFCVPGRAVPDHRRRSGRTPQGVPISAILFGGRRATAVPLVTESLLLAARRLPGRQRGLREDRRGRGHRRRAAPRPLRDAAVLRLQHGRLLRPLAADRRRRPRPAKLPKIYYVNWFRKGDGRQVPVARASARTAAC